MSTTLHAAWLSVFACWTAGVASAQLDLSLHSTVDISHLGFDSIGGADFDDATGRLWVSDASNLVNSVAELDPLTGSAFTIFSASVIPGMTGGPDAMALHPTTKNLLLFSVFGQLIAGEVTQAGAFVKSIATGPWPAAAFDKDGALYAVSDPSPAHLIRVDPDTGAILSSLPLAFAGRPAAADFDPVTGHLFVWEDSALLLHEVDVATAAILSSTDMSPFTINPDFPTGLAFNATGTMLHFSSGLDPVLVNLNRNATPPPFVYCTAKLNSLGCLPAIGWSGVASASASAGFVVQADNVRNQKPGVLLHSVDGRTALPFQGGYICVASPIRRSPPSSSGGHLPPVSDCLAAYRIDMNAYAAGAGAGNPDPLLSRAGTFVTCQWWARDPGALGGSSLSDALQYVVGP